EEIIGYPNGTPSSGKRTVLSKGGSDKNDEIDATVGDEGQIEGTNSKKRDVATVGTGAVVGAVIGGILGGGSGAAVGGAVGGAAGGGVVAATKGHEIDLDPGAQLRIRTGHPARQP